MAYSLYYSKMYSASAVLAFSQIWQGQPFFLGGYRALS